MSEYENFAVEFRKITLQIYCKKKFVEALKYMELLFKRHDSIISAFRYNYTERFDEKKLFQRCFRGEGSEIKIVKKKNTNPMQSEVT